MIDNSLQINEQKECEGQVQLPHLPDWFCYLCRQNKIEKPIVKGYFGDQREIGSDRILNLHITCTLLIPELHLYFTCQDGFEVFNISKVQSEEYQCLICQDSGNSKKGYSIKCREDTCSNKIHLACINKARIYKLENEQKHLKCFYMCRIHARSNPQLYETTYDKLYNEIQKEWILVYQQLEEQEKQRQLQEKAQQQLNIQAKNINSKRNSQKSNSNINSKDEQLKLNEQTNAFRNNSRKNSQKDKQFVSNQDINQQKETLGIGINSGATSTTVEESHSQIIQNSQLEQDPLNDKKRRGRPPKTKEISKFSNKNQQINLKQQQKSIEAMSYSEEKNEQFDSTCKKVFIESSSQVIVYNRDNQICSSFDSNVGCSSKNDALIQLNKLESTSNINKKANMEEKGNLNLKSEVFHSTAYLQLFGKKENKIKQNNDGSNATESTASPLEFNSSEVAQQKQTTDFILNNPPPLPLQQRRSSRQEKNFLNKKNEKPTHSFPAKIGLKKRSNSFDQKTFQNGLMNLNTISSSIYDYQHNKEQNEDLIKSENQKINRRSSVQQVNTQEQIEVVDLEEKQQYLACGYPNFADDNRFQNMENWWSKIDSEYFIKPPNVTQFTTELLEKLKIKQDYEEISFNQNQQIQKETLQHNKHIELNNQHIIFFPKQMSFDDINKFCSTSIAELYLNKQQQPFDNSFGYQMNDEQNDDSEEQEETDFFSCKLEDKDQSNECENKITPFDFYLKPNKQNSAKQTPKRGNQKIQRRSSIKNDQIESFKDCKKSLKIKEKNGLKKQTNFDNLFLLKNLRDSNSCKEDLEQNMLIVDCNDSYEEEQQEKLEDIQINRCDKVEELEQNTIFKKENDQQNVQIKFDEQNSNNIQLASGVQKGHIHLQNKENNKEYSQKGCNQLIEKKEEEDEIEQEIIQNKQEYEEEQNKIKLEHNEENTNQVNLIEDEIEQTVNQIKNEEYDENFVIKTENSQQIDQIISVHTLQPFSRPKSQSQIKQPNERKKKYMHYYSSEYIHEPPPLKLNRKFSVLYHSIAGDGYLMIYDVNENSDIKRSMTAKNKSDYSICGSFQDTQKLTSFMESYEQIKAPGVDENRRRAIPTSDTTPQLMFSKLIHLNNDALKMSIQEQLEINSKFNNLLSNKRNREGLIDEMSLRTIFFEKQWSLNQMRFWDWQNNVQTQIDDENDSLSLKKQSILIWDQLKQSQVKNNLISGYANKKEYNTEIYFLLSSDDESDKDRRHHDKNGHKQNTKSKIPTSLSSNKRLVVQQPDNQQEKQNTVHTSNKTISQKKQSQLNKYNKFYEDCEEFQNIVDDYENKDKQIIVKQNSQQYIEQDEKFADFQREPNDLNLNGQDNNNSLIMKIQIELGKYEMNNDQEEQNKLQDEKVIDQSKLKINQFQESNRKQYLIEDEEQYKQENPEITKKNSIVRQTSQQTSRRSSITSRQQSKQSQKNDQNEGEKEQKDVSNQESDQKQKLRVRKPSNSIYTKQQTKLTPYMKAKQKAMSANPNGITQATPRNTPITVSTIFDNLRRIKINPIVRKIKRNPQFKQKEKLETDCMICFSQKNTDNNPVVYCSDCQQSFHKVCYGIVDLPEGKYFCDKCQTIKTLRQKERHQREVLQQRFSCPLCVETDLPIKLMYQRQASTECNKNQEYKNKYSLYNYWYSFLNGSEFRNNLDSSISFEHIEQKLNNYGELWMHPFCMFTFNLSKYQNGQIILMKTDFPSPSHSSSFPSNKEQTCLDTSISSEDIFTMIKCQLCQKNCGITVKCSEESCEEYFHPLCSFFQGFQCNLQEKQLAIENKNRNISCIHDTSYNYLQNISLNNNPIDISQEEINEFEFQIKCKKHIQIERTVIQNEEENQQNELEENSNPFLVCQIKQTQQNLKQDIDFYLKQIFYRRFNVNYEKMCSYFYYYLDFQQQIYTQQNVKLKFYNTYLQEYQTLHEALSFIKFGSQYKSSTYLDEQMFDNSNNDVNSKILVKFDDFEYEVESDFDYSANNKEEEKIQEDEEEQDEEKVLDEKDIEDKDVKTYEDKRISQKSQSILQPTLSYHKHQQFQRQQQIQQSEDDFMINQQRNNSSNFFKSNQFNYENKDNIEVDELNEDDDYHTTNGFNLKNATNKYNQINRVKNTCISSQNSVSNENQIIQEENELIDEQKSEDDNYNIQKFENTKQSDISSLSNEESVEIDNIYDESDGNQSQN